MPFKRGSGLAVNTIYFGKCYRWIMGEGRGASTVCNEVVGVNG